MILMRMISPDGTHIADVQTPFIPSTSDGQTITLSLANGKVREFWFDGIITTHFFQDGILGATSINRVDVQVKETPDSRSGVLSSG